MIDNIKKALTALRLKNPLVLSLANFVTMDFIANSLLALGASPIMTNSHDELEELVVKSSSITVNIGTVDNIFMERCMIISYFAKRYNKPIILDPVGAGATKIRTDSAINMLPYASIIKGNASEIMALTGKSIRTKGVASCHTTEEARDIAIDLAKIHNCTIVVSGKMDFITDGIRQAEIPYGASLMTLVTGMGCALSAIIAAFSAVTDDAFEASCIGVHYFCMCGELAAKTSAHPGSFRVSVIDHLHEANWDKLRALYVK